MSVYDPEAPLPPKRRASGLRSFFLGAIWALVFLLLLAIGLGYAYHRAHQDRIYPGVTVLGLPVGRATRAEAETALRTYVHSIRQQPLIVRIPDETPTITLMALGLDAADEELARLVDVAWWVGRDLPLWPWLTRQYELLTRGYAVPGSLPLDIDQARPALRQLARQVDREPVSAILRITALDSGYVSRVDPDRPGRRLHVEATLARLQRSLAGHLPSTLDPVFDELPARITAADLVQPRAAVDHLLRSPLVLQGDDQTWPLQPDALLAMLDTAALAGRSNGPVAQLLEDEVRAFVASIAAEANVPPGVPSLRLIGGEPTLQPGQPGKDLDEPVAVRLIMVQAFTAQRRIELPLVTVRPTLTAAAVEQVRRQIDRHLAEPLVLRYGSRQWVLEGRTILDLVSLVPTESAAIPSAPATGPSTWVITLDRARVESFIAAEVAPWVALTAELARFELRAGRIEITAGSSGFLPDHPAIYDALAAAFVNRDPEARVVDVPVRAARPAEIAPLLEPWRRLVARLADRPLVVRHGTYTWSIAPAELAQLFRLRPGAAGPEPYLDPDRLDTHVTAIAVEARRLALGPRTADGRRHPVDVPRTAAAIRAALHSPARSASVVFTAAADLPPPGPPPGQSAPWIPDR